LGGEQIISFDGILNGTTNYILTNMANGMSFNDALNDAKKRGYVEADESLDLDGLDAAAKLVILANWIMRMKVTMPDIKRTGIRKVDEEDIKIAASKNCAVKLIASCNKELVVGPKEIPNLLKQIGSFSKSLKKISRDFKNSLNELAEENDLKDVKKSISDLKNIKNDLDPTVDFKKEINSIKDTVGSLDKENKEINSKEKNTDK
jgi:Sec-independent protein translocase protein TatA